MNIQQLRTIKVLENMVELVKDEEGFAHLFADILDEELNFWLGEDSFGTEGQLDPRGDQRDARIAYDMYYVKGIDI